jgi:hypothetical protein
MNFRFGVLPDFLPAWRLTRATPAPARTDHLTNSGPLLFPSPRRTKKVDDLPSAARWPRECRAKGNGVRRSAPKTTGSLVAGWLLVLAWCAAMPGFAPAIFGALARLEGSHGVELCGAGEAVSVVLTHGAQNAGRPHELVHHHCFLARILASLAVPGADQPDHVVHFATAANADIGEKLAPPPASLTADVAAPNLFPLSALEPPRAEAARPLATGGPAEHAPPVGWIARHGAQLLI